MATYATLIVNAKEVIGERFNNANASVWVEPDTPHGLIVVDGTTIRIGGRREYPDAFGIVTFPDLVTTNSADNPTSFGYRVTIECAPTGSREAPEKIVTSSFPLTADANLAAIPAAWDNITIPPNWRSDFIDQAQAILDQQEAIAGANTADDLITILDNNPASDFRQQQDARQAAAIEAQLAPAVTLVKARERALTEAEHPGGRSLFTRPAGFTVNPGFAILTDGRNFTCNYDVAVQANTGGATYYVNHITGNDTTGTGTEGNPWRGGDKAAAMAADNDTIVIQEGGLIWKAYGFLNTITKRLNIKAAPGVEPIFVAADLLTWSATAGRVGVFQAARTNVRKVVDLAGDPDGAPWGRVASLDACEATPGSWYQASNGSGPVYVNTYAGLTPDPTKILALLTVSMFAAEMTGRTSNSRLYLEGIRCIGSDRGAYFRADSTYTLLLALKDCEFLHGGYSGTSTVDATGLYNGLNVLGNVIVYEQRVRVAYASLDGFNYHELNGRRPSYVLELDCEAHDCGNQSAYVGTSSIPPSNNASTSHETIPVLRINGKYHDTFGPVLADTNAGTKSLNLGCDVWGSLASPGYAFAALDGAEMWVFGGRGWGTDGDLYAATGATLHADNVEADTTGGGGTLSIVSPR